MSDDSGQAPPLWECPCCRINGASGGDPDCMTCGGTGQITSEKAVREAATMGATSAFDLMLQRPPAQQELNRCIEYAVTLCCIWIVERLLDIGANVQVALDACIDKALSARVCDAPLEFMDSDDILGYIWTPEHFEKCGKLLCLLMDRGAKVYSSHFDSMDWAQSFVGEDFPQKAKEAMDMFGEMLATSGPTQVLDLHVDAISDDHWNVKAHSIAGESLASVNVTLASMKVSDLQLQIEEQASIPRWRQHLVFNGMKVDAAAMRSTLICAALRTS